MCTKECNKECNKEKKMICAVCGEHICKIVNDDCKIQGYYCYDDDSICMKCYKKN